jgi:amidase
VRLIYFLGSYLPIQNPSGSSSGSAVAVSAGYAPISIGTETDGSLVFPGVRAALYTIKPTIGEVSQEGIVPVSPTFDSAGPFGKTPYDIAAVLDVIVPETSPSRKSQSFTSVLSGSWSDLRVGALDPEIWRLPKTLAPERGNASVQMVWNLLFDMVYAHWWKISETFAAYNKIKPLVKSFHENIGLATPDSLMIDGVNARFMIMSKSNHPFSPCIQSSRRRS